MIRWISAAARPLSLRFARIPPRSGPFEGAMATAPQQATTLSDAEYAQFSPETNESVIPSKGIFFGSSSSSVSNSPIGPSAAKGFSSAGVASILGLVQAPWYSKLGSTLSFTPVNDTTVSTLVTHLTLGKGDLVCVIPGSKEDEAILLNNFQKAGLRVWVPTEAGKVPHHVLSEAAALIATQGAVDKVDVHTWSMAAQDRTSPLTVVGMGSASDGFDGLARLWSAWKAGGTEHTGSRWGGFMGLDKLQMMRLQE